MSGRIVVERLGGLAGIGLPGSRIRSRADIAEDELRPAEAAAIAALFTRAKSAPPPKPDAFRYRITRATPRGNEMIEVPEQDVPASIRSSSIMYSFRSYPRPSMIADVACWVPKSIDTHNTRFIGGMSSQRITCRVGSHMS